MGRQFGRNALEQMTAVLVDTSVWIDFLNNTEPASRESALLQNLVAYNLPVCICPVIYQEILQGIRNDKVFADIKNILLDFNILNFNMMGVTNHAVNLYRSLRKRGITIRKSADCLIASYAIMGEMYLLHKDKDFVEISKGSNLMLY